MKKIFLVLSLFFALEAMGQSSTDSLKLVQMQDKIEKLEKSRDNFLWFLEILGVVTVGALIAIYKDIKAKIGKLVENETTKKLEETVKLKLAEYPFFRAYDQEQQAKQNKKIVVVGSKDQDADFLNYLTNIGFKDIKQASIDQKLTDLIEGVHLVLFDNRKGNLKQTQMDAIVQEFPTQVYYFYLSSEAGPRWEGVKPEKKMGFANSLGRLEQNLIDLLK